MYLDHFGLREPPFKITPNTEFFYAGGNRGAILDALLYAVTNGEGIIKVTGEIGSGKTMLCRMLGNLLPENIDVIVLVNPSLSQDEILYTIAEELGLNLAEQRISVVIRELQRNLIEKHEQGHQVVAFLDEAQAMPLDSLEEIRLLSNLETAHHKLLQIVLFGQPELNESLGLPRMRQLKERITHSFIIPPLSGKEIPEYLMFRMRAAGYRGPEIFDDDAIRLIEGSSKGITRRVNILADKALLSAFSENTHNIGAKQMKEAIADSDFYVAEPSRPPLKKIGVAVMLALLGTGLVAGWQHYADMSPARATPPAPTPTPIIQPASRPAVKATLPAVIQTQAPATPTSEPASSVQTAKEIAPPSVAMPPVNEKSAVAAPKPAATEKPAQVVRAPSAIQQGKLVVVANSAQASTGSESVKPMPPPVNEKSTMIEPKPATKGKPARIVHAPSPAHQNKSAAADPAQTPVDSKMGNLQKEATAPVSTPFQVQMDATRAWLGTQNTHHYVIQLRTLFEPYTLPQITQVLDDIKKETGLQDVYIYLFSPANTDKRQLRIILGSFSSRDQAIAAIAKLPASYKTSHPFRRTIKGIKDEIEQQPH